MSTIDLDVGGDAVFPREVQHRLALRDAAHAVSGHALPARDYGEGRQLQRLARRADDRLQQLPAAAPSGCPADTVSMTPSMVPAAAFISSGSRLTRNASAPRRSIASSRLPGPGDELTTVTFIRNGLPNLTAVWACGQAHRGQRRRGACCLAHSGRTAPRGHTHHDACAQHR
ncbi:hypothetical protein PR202_gb22700 [Eleusine coracana subsp. coracana]|uniref:Uncharacterized protein n=1 Tax=Eleusine coracana subsp. coracana TaxID=191504 RepID=A0AAV5FEG3_ELECO|nr:hypothetical protein PR202_gb22700 [Eleusine coracana subsp. coracana]